MTMFHLKQETLPNPLPITNGGTGAQTAAAALASLGGAPTLNPVFTGVPIAPTILIRSDATSRIGQLHLSGDLATSGASQFYFDGWNSSGNAAASPAFIARTGRGTQAAPRRTLNNDQLFGVAARGCYAADNSAIATIESGGRAGVFMFAAEDHTSVGQGSRLEVHTTAIGSNSKTTAAIFGADKSLTVGGSVIATSFTGSGAGLTAIPQAGVAGLTAAIAAKEPLLGNPAADGHVLSSSAAGVRQWVTLPTSPSEHNALLNRDVAGNHAKLIPTVDGVGAVQITKANGLTAVVRVDTLNQRTAFNVSTPQVRIDVGGYLRLRQDAEYSHLPIGTRYTNFAGLGPLVLTDRVSVGDGIFQNLGLHWNLIEDWKPYNTSDPNTLLTPVWKLTSASNNYEYGAFFGLTPYGDFVWQTTQPGPENTEASWNQVALAINYNGNIGVGLQAGVASTKLDVNGSSIRIRGSKTPASAAAAGNAGEICWSSGYIYVCVAANTWKRAALSTW